MLWLLKEHEFLDEDSVLYYGQSLLNRVQFVNEDNFLLPRFHFVIISVVITRGQNRGLTC